MASHIRVFHAVDGMFHKFKKKGKPIKEDSDSLKTEYVEADSETVDMTDIAPSDLRVLEKEGSVAKPSLESDILSEESVFHTSHNVSVVENVNEIDEFGKLKSSQHVRQMDEMYRTASTVINDANGGTFSEKSEFGRKSLADLTDADVFEDVHVDMVASKLERNAVTKDGEVSLESLENSRFDSTIKTPDRHQEAFESVSKLATFKPGDSMLQVEHNSFLIDESSGESENKVFVTHSDRFYERERVGDTQLVEASVIGNPDEMAVPTNTTEQKRKYIEIKSDEKPTKMAIPTVPDKAIKKEGIINENESPIPRNLGLGNISSDPPKTGRITRWWRSGKIVVTRWFTLIQGKIINPSVVEEKPVDAKPTLDEVQTDASSLTKMEKSKLCSCDIEPKFFFNKVKFYPALAIINFVGIIIQYTINGLSSSGPDGTLFLNKTGDLSDKYETAITPAGWTFSIWGFIYTWQAVWVVFTLVNICRKGSKGEPAYKDPAYIPNTVFLIQLLISAFNIAWLISFDREEIEAAAAVLIIYTLLQYLLLTVSVRALDQASPKLVEQERTVDIWLHRGMLQNGVGMQLAWVNIATLLNLQMVLIYSGDEVLCVDDAGTVALAILSVHVVALPIMDMVLLDRYTRYLITPYIVVVVALGGSISKNWDSEATNSIFSAVLISYASGLLGFKIALSVYRHFNRPRFTTKCPCMLERESHE